MFCAVPTVSDCCVDAKDCTSLEEDPKVFASSLVFKFETRAPEPAPPLSPPLVPRLCCHTPPSCELLCRHGPTLDNPEVLSVGRVAPGVPAKAGAAPLTTGPRAGAPPPVGGRFGTILAIAVSSRIYCQ